MADRDRRDLITPLPGITPTKPGSATFPFPGVQADVYDETGSSVLGGGGYLVLKHPWPAMARTTWGDPDRYASTYFGLFGLETYVAGDGARRDEDGYFWLLGRIDDVMNVAGHRLSTFEIESALVDNPKVAEAAVVSRPDEVIGEAIVAFVTLKQGIEGNDDVAKELRAHVGEKIGKIACPHGSSSRPTCPRRGRARSCDGCSATRRRPPARGRDDPRERRDRRCDPRDGEQQPAE